jgi:hypothetical protein
MTTNRPTVSDAAYTGPFGSITAAIDPHTEGDRVGVLVTLLSAFSSVIDHDVKVAHGKTQPLGFWPVLVGPTGRGRKGTARGAAMQVLTAAYAGYMETSTVEGCPRTGEGFIDALASMATNDVANPAFLVEEEGDNLIDAAKRSKTLGVAFRKAWDGTTLTNITRQGATVVRRPHLGIVMHVQPKNWATISGTKDATGGTYNRFFPVYVERTKTVRLSQARTPSAVVVAIARELRAMAAYARDVSEVTMPEYVEDVFETKHRPVVEALTLGTEALAQYAERALGYMLRLSALYALADRRDEISVQDLDAATALVTYMVDTVTYVLPDAQSAHGDLPVRIEAYIREGGETGRTSTEILKRYGIKRAELDMIVSANPSLTVEPGPYTGGRRADVFRYVDLDATTYRAEADGPHVEHDASEESEASRFAIVAAIEPEPKEESASTGDASKGSIYDLTDVWESEEEETESEPVKAQPVEDDDDLSPWERLMSRQTA